MTRESAYSKEQAPYTSSSRMPSESKAEQSVMAIALNHPEKLYKRNRGVLKMKKTQLRDFAKTSRAGLPKHVGRTKR